MDLSLIVGLIVGFDALGMGLIVEGGELGGIIGIPAFIIVVPGSLGVAIVGSGIGGIVRIPKLFALTLRPVGMDPGELMGSWYPSPRKPVAKGSCHLKKNSSRRVSGSSSTAPIPSKSAPSSKSIFSLWKSATNSA